jgi:single-stranded DNA-binding protein
MLIGSLLKKGGEERMMSFNLVVLAGHVGQDPESRAAADGTPVTSFRLAVDAYAGKDESGKTKDVPMWVTVNAWKNLSETVSKLVKKGTVHCRVPRLSNGKGEKAY